MELLLDTLKWSAAVGAAALVLTLLKPLLDRRYSANWRYGVWLALSVMLLLAPMRWEALLPRTPVEPPVVVDVPRVSVDLQLRDGVAVTVLPAGAPSLPAGTGGRGTREPLPLEAVLGTLWLAGAGLFLLYHLAGTRRFLRRARRWSRPAGEEASRVYEAVCREMGLEKAPPLSVSAAVESPMAAGLFRPGLLLPEEEFPPRQLVFILRHELTHCRRRDLWYKLVLLLANALHWFNPLVWLLRREAERDLELTCDGAVMAGADAQTRRAYSEALLAAIRPRRQRAVLSTHFYGGRRAMKERFRNILGKRGRRRGGVILAAALIATVAGACAFGVRTSGALSPEELARWQEKVDAPEFQPWISRMYTDPALLPPEELRGESAPVRARVTSGSREGDMVTLELEGNFPNGLTQGSLILRDGQPIYFAPPFYVVVEGEARKLMNTRASLHIAEAAENDFITGALEFPEMYIIDLTCRESMAFDGVTYYVWTLRYRLRPNDMGNVQLSGGMNAENGWVTEQDSMGRPLLIFSLDQRGTPALEEQTWTTNHGARPEGGWTWEEYLYCKLHMGLSGLENGVTGGWPALNEELLDSLRNGRDTWATDPEDTARTYLHRAYGVEDYKSVETLRTFQADGAEYGHDQSVLLRYDLGDARGGVTLLLTRVAGAPEDGSPEIRFWQVSGQLWERTPPVPVPEPDPAETPDAAVPQPPADTPTPRPAPRPEPDGGTAVPPADPNIGPTGVIGDFDGDGRPDPDFLGGYTRVDDPALGYPVYLPKNPEDTPFLIDPSTGVPIYIFGSLPTGVTAAPEPDPEIRTSTGTIGDFDGDGVPDGDPSGGLAIPDPEIRTSTGVIGEGLEP